MNLPLPPINQGTGIVAVALAPGTPLNATAGEGGLLAQVVIYCAGKSAAGSIPPPDTDPPTLAPLDAYNAAAYGALAPTGSASLTAYSQTSGYVSQSNDDGSSSYTDYANTGPINWAAYAGMQYKLRVVFYQPWVGSGNTLKVSWRERTALQTGTKTGSTSATGQVNPPSYSESATETYVPFSEILTPNPGDAYVETNLYTVEGPSLAVGATVSVVGPNDPRLLAPGFQIATTQQSAAKVGFLSYTQPQPAPGMLVEPQPVYTLETASTAPDAPAGTQYSGYQDISSGYATSTFSNNVPGKYRSRSNRSTGDQYQPGEEASFYGALDNIRQAVSVAPTVVQWPGNLVMTLSSPQDTSTIMTPVAAALAAVNYGTDFPSGQVEPGMQINFPSGRQNPASAVTGAIIALRNLPAHEQNYVARKGVYSIWIYFTISGGLTSIWDQAAPLVNSGSLDFRWTREVIDLDTGERKSTPVTWTLPFNGVAGSAMPTSALPVTAGYFVSPLYVEDAPGSNQRVEISGMAITTTDLDCLAIAPQVELVAGT